MKTSSPAATERPEIVFGPLAPDLIRQEILADILESTAAAQPNKTALVFGDRRLTYGELNRAADDVASRLIDEGVVPGRIVGLWLPRGIDLLVAQAAIAKTGAAWLPFDADTPPERIAVCLEDASAVGIVTIADWSYRLLPLDHKSWAMEDLQKRTTGPMRRRDGALPQHPAYVIYTSGSTGKPKGIEINQGSICHFLRSENSYLGIKSSDTVYQGFSAAFDMSFEEIWISYLVGATLWIAPKEVATDPEALPQALIDNQVTVLHAVPTLLALFNQDVPNLRLINLGGEMCPEALVARWARAGRQIFNTYGPTEATVSASLAELQAGEPVTIGKPLPNYGMMVLEASFENGPQLVPVGETGELCITGPGVAAGYLARPDLTAEKFILNPWSASEADKRLYRTGDLARIDEHGRVHCLGRADDQVKIRGFRVELGEIEAVLAAQSGVGTAAVVLREDDGISQLVAFLVPDPGAHLAVPILRTALSDRLPPYMVPSRYEILDEMPRLSSGKIDRKILKNQPLTVAAPPSEESDTPETPAEILLFQGLTKLFPGQPLRRDMDFFGDLGGHSLLAARLASFLRADPRFSHATVRDIYQNRLVGDIAAALANAVQPAKVDTHWTPPPTAKRIVCGLAQAAAVPGLVAMRMAQWLAPFFTYHFFTGEPDDSIALAVAASVGAYLAATVLEFILAIVLKWLIIGRVKPGRYPLWGVTYFRWWLTDRILETAPTFMINGSSLYTWWLRALGAKVGRDVTIGSITLRAPDLLSIGDGVSIGNATNLENARVERGELILGQITIEREASIGSYSVLEGNTHVGEYGHLDGQSGLADGEAVPALRVWGGSPARDLRAFDPKSIPPRPVVERRRHVGEAVFFLFGALFVAILFFLPVFPSFMLIDWLDDSDPGAVSIGFQLIKYFLLAFPATAVLIVLTALISAGIRWSVLPRLKQGSWPVHSNVYCSKWLVNQIQESSLNVLHGVYATVFAPSWYRLLGAKVGKDAEISTALGVVPDMLTLGDETFIADAVLLGDEQIDGGWMSMQPTVISKRSFVGNGSYVPDGTILPENVLIGVHSLVPENRRMREGDTWLGSPPINLPAREEVKGFPEELTFKPSKLRRLGRGLVEAFRITAPHALVIAFGYTMVLNIMPYASAGRWLDVAWYLTVSGLLYGLGCYVFVLLLKWLCIGRYKKHAVPMWTPFVWLSEAVTNLYEGVTIPNFMRYLRGTPWLSNAFNLLGCRIGHGVYLDTTDITEFDVVTIGNYSELNALSCPQTHLFEDRVMKIDTISIGTKVTIGPRSSVLYSAEVADHVRLGPLTLVMKGESIPAATSWRGCPAAPDRG